MTPLEKSQFSKHFIRLTLTGGWIVDRNKPKLITFYAFYKMLMVGISLFGASLFFIDLYLVFGNFKKVTWNLCVTTLFTGGLAKSIYLYQHNIIIEKLRMRLHRDAELRIHPEYVEIHKGALKKLSFIEWYFYAGGFIFVPIWLVVRFKTHFWGEREWPLPLRLPVPINKEDDLQYIAGYAVVSFAGIVGLIFIAHIELSMFSLLIQILREYEVLLKDIPKINDLFEDDYETNKRKYRSISCEVNPHLRHKKARMIVKGFAIRQQRIIEYTECFETCYSLPLLLQFFVVTVLVVTSSMQCLIESGNISTNLSYQMGYLIVLTLDMFTVCLLATKIDTYCQEIGKAVYFTCWYKMDSDIQKDLYMILVRAQRPPKITAGKFFELNLHAFMTLMRNIYSWLTLFEQLDFKIN